MPDLPHLLTVTSVVTYAAPSAWGNLGFPECTQDGDIYYYTGRPTGDLEVLKVSPDAYALYHLPSSTGKLGQYGGMSVTVDGRLWIAVYSDDRVVAISLGHNGEVADHVTLEVPSPFQMEQFAAFNDGAFFVEGHRTSASGSQTHERYAAIIASSGKLQTMLELELPTFHAAMIPPDGGVTIGSDSNAYLITAHEVIVISESGTVLRHLPFKKPDEDSAAQKIAVSGGQVAIWLSKADQQRNVTTELLVMDAQSGDRIGIYKAGDGLPSMPDCFSRRSGFLFLEGAIDGKAQLLSAALH